MKRMFLPLMLLSLVVVMSAGSAFALPTYTINDMESSDWTEVRRNHSGDILDDDSPNPGEWVDVIGPTNQFQVHGIDIRLDDTFVYFDLYTNFNDDGKYSVGSATAWLADIAFDTDPTSPFSFDYGARLLDPSTYTGGGDKPTNETLLQGVYKVNSWETSKDFFEPKSGLIYGGHWGTELDKSEVNVAISGIEDIPNPTGFDERLAPVAITKNIISGSPTGNPGDPLYRWEVKMAATVLSNATDGSDGLVGMGLSEGDKLGILWGGATCANDTIYGEWTVDLPGGGFEPIPEPGTLLLLGFGLLGLAGYGICRKKRS